VARAMAEGIRKKTGAAVGVGITGIAGPGLGTGADEGKPIGLVYVGIAIAAMPGVAAETKSIEVNISGDRERIRWWASQHALELVRKVLLERVY